MQNELDASREKRASPPPPKLNLGFDVCASTFGNYPWDDWERFALARGLDAELAGLGRLLVREAYNHGWEAWLQALCGWSDDGQALLAFALRAPRQARRQWESGSRSATPTARSAIACPRPRRRDAS